MTPPGIKSALAGAGKLVGTGTQQQLVGNTAPRNPIVSAVQFANVTARTGGATMNAHDLSMTEAGKDHGYAVGGMQGTTSKRRIPTADVAAPGRNLGLDTILQQRNRVRRSTDNPAANVGSWITGKGRADIDASEVEMNRASAVKKGKRRHEKAIFDIHAAKDINL